MKIAHNIKLSVFGKEDENIEQIQETIKKLFPFNTEKFLTTKKAIGFDEKIIKTYEVNIDNNQLVNKFLFNLKENLSADQKEMIIRQLDSRIDENLNLFIRLNKPKLIDNKFFITDDGNCFHIRIKIAAFPKKKEIAKQIMLDFLVQQQI